MSAEESRPADDRAANEQSTTTESDDTAGDRRGWTFADGVFPEDGPPPEEPPAPEEEPTVPTWRPVDLGPYLDGTHVPAVPGILRRTDDVGLLYPGKVHWFHGESESGKSWVALIAAARQLLVGERVLYVDHESGPADVAGRLHALGVPAEIIASGLHYVRPDVSASAEVTAFEALLSTEYVLAVVDGVTDGMGLAGVSSVDNDEVARWVRQMPRRIAHRTGAAVACIDHVTKSNDTRGRFAIGAQAKMAGLDGAAYVVECVKPLGRGMVGTIVLKVAKDRPGSIRPHGGGRWTAGDRTQEIARITLDSTDPDAIAVTVAPPGAGADEDRAAWRPTGYMEKASRYIEANPGASDRAVRAGAGGKALHVDTALQFLLDDGYVAVIKPTGTGKASSWTSVKPYREPPEDGTRSTGSGTSSGPRPGHGGDTVGTRS